MTIKTSMPSTEPPLKRYLRQHLLRQGSGAVAGRLAATGQWDTKATVMKSIRMLSPSEEPKESGALAYAATTEPTVAEPPEATAGKPSAEDTPLATSLVNSQPHGVGPIWKAAQKTRREKRQASSEPDSRRKPTGRTRAIAPQRSSEQHELESVLGQEEGALLATEGAPSELTPEAAEADVGTTQPMYVELSPGADVAEEEDEEEEEEEKLEEEEEDVESAEAIEETVQEQPPEPRELRYPPKASLATGPAITTPASIEEFQEFVNPGRKKTIATATSMAKPSRTKTSQLRGP